MDKVNSIQSIPSEISKKVDEISLILDSGAELDEKNELGKVLICKERKLKFKERNLILFDNQCLLVIDGENPRPKKVFFLDACTITPYQNTPYSFLIKDHVHKRNYIVKWATLTSTCLDTSTVNLLPISNNNEYYNNTIEKPPPIMDFLRDFTLGHDNMSTLSSSDFSVIQYKSNFTENTFENLMQLKWLSFLLKSTLTFPWKGPLRYLPILAELIMVANVALIALASSKQVDQLVWNMPFILFAVISIYNHYFLSHILQTQHLEYLIAVGLSRKRVSEFLQRVTGIAGVSFLVFGCVFIVLLFLTMLQNYRMLPQEYFIISVVSNFIVLSLNLPAALMSFMTFAFIARLHVYSISYISTLVKRMAATNTLSPIILYTHILHQQHLISRTVKRTNGLFVDIFLIFAFFFVFEIFHLTRTTDAIQIVMSVVLIVMSFYVLLIVALPASRLNLVCDRTYQQVLFFCNFYQQGELNEKDKWHYKKLAFMLERMNLGYYLYDQIKVTFSWVFSILYIFGGIAVFILAQSSVFK